MELYNKINDLLELHPFNLQKNKKDENFLEILSLQIQYHLDRCEPYKLWYERNGFKKANEIIKLDDIPFIPSSVFKHVNLNSTNDGLKEIQSSGTTSQLKSKIFIDSQTSKNQIKSLSKILTSIIGKKRRPFFICDIEPDSIIKRDGSMSARFAGMSGYLLAAKTRHYLLKLDISGEIIFNEKAVETLSNISKSEPVVIIGYTYMIWEHLINRPFVDFGIKLNKETKLIHFGGWKKLANKNISKSELINKIKLKLKITKNSIFDIYGFTEQLGTIYPSKGLDGCRVSSYSNVLVRDTSTLEIIEDGQEGFLQFISVLPVSYPGFSILNDDIGTITKRSLTDDGIEIIEFSVSSRLEQAESRGCGDTLPENFYI